MLAILLLLALSGACGWLGFQLRPNDKTASAVAFGFSAIFLMLLGIAIFVI